MPFSPLRKMLNHQEQWYLCFSGSPVSVRIRWNMWILSSNGQKAHTNRMVHTMLTDSQGLGQHARSLSLNQTTGWKPPIEREEHYTELGIRVCGSRLRSWARIPPLSDLQNTEFYKWASNGPSSSENIQVFNRQLTPKCWSLAGIFSHTHSQFLKQSKNKRRKWATSQNLVSHYNTDP